ncbi:hypothetical protein K7432_011618 [Basidiobolus ranarum]|uniref:Uncharacterized protein n=1 Tax=Basidiobolus ranarum TaxID=34480 RepID=A0ABR2WM13_9FUNG
MDSDSEFTDAQEYIQPSVKESTADKEVSVQSPTTLSLNGDKQIEINHPHSYDSEHSFPQSDLEVQQNGHHLEDSHDVNVDIKPIPNLIDFEMESDSAISLAGKLSPPKDSYKTLADFEFTEMETNPNTFHTNDLLAEFDNFHLGQKLDTTDLIGEFDDFESKGNFSEIKSDESPVLKTDALIPQEDIVEPCTLERDLEDTQQDFQDTSDSMIQLEKRDIENGLENDENGDHKDSFDDFDEPSFNDAENFGDEFNGFDEQVNHSGEEFGDDFNDDFSNMNHDDFNDFGDDFDDFAEASPIPRIDDTPLSGLLSNDPELAKNTVTKILGGIFETSPENLTVDTTETKERHRLWSAVIEQKANSNGKSMEPFEWIRSQIRRDFLISLNIPINLDEIYTRRASVLKIDTPAVHPGSGPTDEFDIAMARSLCNLSEETIRDYPINDLISLLDQLTSLSKQTNSYFDFWIKQQEKVKAEAEAIHKTIECMALHAQKNRDKQSGESKWFKKRISGISKGTSPRNSSSIDVSRRRLSM